MTTYLERLPASSGSRRPVRGRDWNRWLASALAVANAATTQRHVGNARSRRATSVVRRVVLAVAAFAVLAGVMASELLGGSSAAADVGGGETPAKQVITVTRGDNLWSLAGRLDARRNGDRRTVVARIVELNGLVGDRIYVGQQLVVPDVASL